MTDFNPDLSLPEDTKKQLPIETEPPVFKSIVTNDSASINISQLVALTKEHIADDERARIEYDVINAQLLDILERMTPRELTDYAKLKLKEREYHNNAIMQAFKFGMQVEFAREMFLGSNRVERVKDMTKEKAIKDAMSGANSLLNKSKELKAEIEKEG